MKLPEGHLVKNPEASKITSSPSFMKPTIA